MQITNMGTLHTVSACYKAKLLSSAAATNGKNGELLMESCCAGSMACANGLHWNHMA